MTDITTTPAPDDAPDHWTLPDGLDALVTSLTLRAIVYGQAALQQEIAGGPATDTMMEEGYKLFAAEAALRECASKMLLTAMAMERPATLLPLGSVPNTIRVRSNDFDKTRDLCGALARLGFPSLRVYEAAGTSEVQHPVLGLLHITFAHA